MDDLVEWARETARQQMPTQELVEKSGLWVMADEIERLREHERMVADRLQVVCERLGCQPGRSRLNFLEEFSSLHTKEQSGG